MVETMLNNPALDVKKIARTVGVHRSTLYRHFPQARMRAEG